MPAAAPPVTTAAVRHPLLPSLTAGGCRRRPCCGGTQSHRRCRWGGPPRWHVGPTVDGHLLAPGAGGGVAASLTGRGGDGTPFSSKRGTPPPPPPPPWLPPVRRREVIGRRRRGGSGHCRRLLGTEPMVVKGSLRVKSAAHRTNGRACPGGGRPPPLLPPGWPPAAVAAAMGMARRGSPSADRGAGRVPAHGGCADADSAGGGRTPYDAHLGEPPPPHPVTDVEATMARVAANRRRC